MLGLYGALDQGIPQTDVEAMRAALKAAGKTGSDISVYPDAQHGFHADYRASYNEADAKDGWARMLARISAPTEVAWPVEPLLPHCSLRKAGSTLASRAG